MAGGPQSPAESGSPRPRLFGGAWYAPHASAASPSSLRHQTVGQPEIPSQRRARARYQLAPRAPRACLVGCKQSCGRASCHRGGLSPDRAASAVRCPRPEGGGPADPGGADAQMLRRLSPASPSMAVSFSRIRVCRAGDARARRDPSAMARPRLEAVPDPGHTAQGDGQQGECRGDGDLLGYFVVASVGAPVVR